jgi:hypothetical protein
MVSQSKKIWYAEGKLKKISENTINFLAGDTLNMDDPLSAVDLDDLSFSAFICASNNLDFIVLSHRHRSHLAHEPLFLSRQNRSANRLCPYRSRND